MFITINFFFNRKIQNVGLAERYNNDLEFSTKLKMFPALAFVPEEDVEDAFRILSENADLPEECLEVIDYFESNWIGRSSRRPPLYSSAIWSCHFAVKNKLPRTNNSVEGWHNGFNDLVVANPVIWPFLDAIKNEHSKNVLTLNQIISGTHQSIKLKKYKNLDDRIYLCVDNYKKENLIEFLKGVSCNFS